MNDVEPSYLDWLAQLILATSKEPARDFDRDMALDLLGAVAVKLKCYFVWQICACRAHENDNDLTEEEHLQALIFGQRLNDALSLKLYGAEALVDRQTRLPTRLFIFRGTNGWVDADTLLNMLAEIGRKAVSRHWNRIAWTRQKILRNIRQINARMRDGAVMQLSAQAATINPRSWKQRSLASAGNSFHVRIVYGTGFFTATLKIGDLIVSRRRLTPNIFMAHLTETERAAIDSQFAGRLLTGGVFELLLALRSQDPSAAQRLQEFYDLLLRPLLSKSEVLAAIATLGPYPTLVITTHGVLAQIPFHALHDGQAYVAERFNVVMANAIPSDVEFGFGSMDIDGMSGGRELPSNFEIRFLGDATGLPQVVHELAFYREREKIDGVASGLVVVDEGPWTTATVQQAMTPPGVVIISAHMRASARSARAAWLHSPDGGKIVLSDALKNGIFADLVVLSGCNSLAQTDWLAESEDSQVGVLRRAGARSVVATLWPVNDFAARRYNELLVTGLLSGHSRAKSHGDALRTLMREQASETQIGFGERIIRQDGKGTPRRQAPLTLTDPYYWAAFNLYGAWN